MHGGRRPGAGAPKGNINAVKTGAHSPRVQAIIRILMDEPETRAIIERLQAVSAREVSGFAAGIAGSIATLAADPGAPPPGPPATSQATAAVSEPLEVRLAKRIRRARILADQEDYIEWMESQEYVPLEADPRWGHTPFSDGYEPSSANNQDSRRPQSIKRRFRRKTKRARQ